MNTMKKTLALLLSLVMILALAACGGDKSTDTPNEDTKKEETTTPDATTPDDAAGEETSDGNNLKGKKITVLLKSYTHMFWIEAANEAKALGEEYGCEVEILAPTVANSNEEQIQLIENSLVNPPDLYVIVPADSAGIAPAIQQINDAGIPLVNVNTKITDTSVSYDSFISCNQYNLGYTTITTAIEKIGEEGNAVVIFGKPGAQTYVERGEGADAAFAEHSGWTVLDNQIANGDRTQAMTVMQTLLTKYEDIDMVFAQDGEMALGAMEAIRQAGKTADIKVVGVNSNAEMCQAITDGNLFMTYDGSAALQTRKGFEVANMVLGGEAVEDVYYSEIALVDSSNVAEYAKRYE